MNLFNVGDGALFLFDGFTDPVDAEMSVNSLLCELP